MQHPPELRRLVASKRESGMSYAKIGAELNLSKSTVEGIVKRCQENGSCASAPRCGRPRKISRAADKRILSAAKKSRRTSAQSIATLINTSYGTDVSAQTIRKRLRSARLDGHDARKKPKTHKEQSLAHAKAETMMLGRPPAKRESAPVTQEAAVNEGFVEFASQPDTVYRYKMACESEAIHFWLEDPASKKQ